MKDPKELKAKYDARLVTLEADKVRIAGKAKRVDEKIAEVKGLLAKCAE